MVDEKYAFRRATLADLAAIVGLYKVSIISVWESIGREYDLNRIRESITEHLEKDAGWVAEYKGSVVGTIFAVLFKHWITNQKTLETHALHIHKDHQGKGIGTKLVDLAEMYARTNGATRARVACQHKNLDGVRFYEKMGYEKGEWLFVKKLNTQPK